MAIKNINLGGDNNFVNGVDPDFYIHLNDTFDALYDLYNKNNWE